MTISALLLFFVSDNIFLLLRIFLSIWNLSFAFREHVRLSVKHFPRDFLRFPLLENVVLFLFLQVESNCTDSPCEDGKGCGYFKLTKSDWSLCGKPMGRKYCMFIVSFTFAQISWRKE